MRNDLKIYDRKKTVESNVWQRVSCLYFPFPTEEVHEGSIDLTIPKLALFARGTTEYIPSKAPVFYNPLMMLNRDVAVLALKAYQKRVDRPLRICDPLTGCGVRGLRFASEVSGIDLVILNDLNLHAVRLAQLNSQKNGLTQNVFVENIDARTLLGIYASRKKFDAIDVDPYGSPSPFIDSALVALRNDGLLAVTATDVAPLCGVNPKACIRKYFGKPLRTEYCHELALRILISCVILTAAKHDLGVTVLFSHSTDHYLRTYVQVKRGAKRANNTLANVGYVLHCFNCLNRKWIGSLMPFLSRTCDNCNDEMAIAGPLWLGKIADKEFCRDMCEEMGNTTLGTGKRLSRLLTTILEEIDAPPTYFVLDKICKKLGVPATSRRKVVQKIGEMGYQAVRTHFNPNGIKSDASIRVIEEAIKAHQIH